MAQRNVQKVEAEPAVELARALLDAVGLPLWLAAPDGRLLASSQAFADLAGRPEHLDEAFEPPGAAGSLLEALRRSGSEANRDVCLPGGARPHTAHVASVRWVELEGTILVVGWLQPVDEAAAGAEWLVNQIAHTLRNPIFAATMQCESISLRAASSPKLTRPLEILFNQLRRLESIIEEMLLYGRPGKVEPRRLCLGEVLEPMVAAFANPERDETAEIVLELADTDLSVDWDPRAVGLILERLINNAIEHTEPPHRIELEATCDDDDQVVLVVRDHGSGIPEQISGRIFMPFFPQHRGRPGLGLAVARKLTSLLGGRLEVRNRPDQGAEARCTIPRSILVR